jgi:hypothetical protein
MKLKLFLWVSGWVAVFLVGTAASLPAQQKFKTERTVIYYSASQDLLEMDRRLHALKVSSAETPGAFSDDSVPARLAGKIDRLVARVGQILRLSPDNLPGVRLFLLPNGREVRERYLALQPANQRSSFGRGSLEAFHEARSRAILSLRHLHPGILAHELTHFLLCSAVSDRPSRAVQEDWANYVETQVR